MKTTLIKRQSFTGHLILVERLLRYSHLSQVIFTAIIA